MTYGDINKEQKEAKVTEREKDNIDRQIDRVRERE